MGVHPKFVHLNCHNAVAVADQLRHDVTVVGADVVALNEPYVSEGSVRGTPTGWAQVHSAGNRFRAALWVSPRISFCAIARHPDVVAIRVRWSKRNVMIITCYASPSEDICLVLDQLELLLAAYPDDDVILSGDLNAHSMIWGPKPTNPRGRAVIAFASNANLEIVNDPDSPPSFCSPAGESWIDLLLVRYCARRISGWEISDVESLSDHRFMTWTFLGKPAHRLPAEACRRWFPKDLVWKDFLHDLRDADLNLYDFATPDLGIEHLVSTLTELCKKHERRRSKGQKGTPWWTPELTSQRSRLRALRRLSKTVPEPGRRAKLEALYRRKRAEYKKCILHTKRTSFRRFISEGLVTDKFGQVMEVVRGKWSREVPEKLVTSSGVEVSTWEESQHALATHHFLSADDVQQSGDLRTDEPDPFSVEELEFACESLTRGKAPGHDGISLELVHEVLKSHPKWLLALYNQCLTQSCFPGTWKRAIAVYFPKEGKPKCDPGSYRPICLLPALGKVLDRMCASRLTEHLERNGLLDARQYGFRKNLSTVDALRNVQDFMALSKERGDFTCLLTLDIKSAFNSVRRTDILRLLVELRTDPHLLGLIVDFMNLRTVLIHGGEHGYNVGVPQGSCLGPILWLVVINDLLRRFSINEAWAIQAFADDVFVLARNRAVMRFTEILGPVLDELHRWSMECNLAFSYEKCLYTVVPPKGSLRSEPTRIIRLNGRKVAFRRSIKYLGVTFECNKSWMPHLTQVQEKAFKVMHKMNRLATANWGLKPRVRKQIYSAVAEKILLYAAPIWFSGNVVVRNRLLSAQRSLLLCVTKCYKTASTNALQVLSGVLPLDIRAEVDRDITALMRWRIDIPGTALIPEAVELWRPSQRREDLGRIPWTMDLTPRTTCSYYTDGSRQEDGTTGCAFLAVLHGQIVTESQFRLTDGAEVFAAEVHAIKEALTDAHLKGLRELDIYSDSRSALQALNSLVPRHRAIAEIRNLVRHFEIKPHMHWIRAHVGYAHNERADVLAKAATGRPSVDVEVKLTSHQLKREMLGRANKQWQARWDRSETGRALYEIFPRVSLRRLQGDFYVNQALTGHGTFGDHQARFFGADATCFCGESDSTVVHSLYVCPLWEFVRERFFPRNFLNLSLRDLCLDGYGRKGVRMIIHKLLLRTLDRNLGRRRDGRQTRAR